MQRAYFRLRWKENIWFHRGSICNYESNYGYKSNTVAHNQRDFPQV